MKYRILYDMKSRFRVAFGRVQIVEADTPEAALALVTADVAQDSRELDAGGCSPDVTAREIRAMPS